MSTSARTKSLSPFLPLFFNDGDDSRTDLVFVIGIFCFLILNTPKLGWLYNIHSTINNKGCLDLKDIQGNDEVVGYQGEQNWVEIWNLWVTRIPMVCFFFLSSEIVSWNSGNGMCILFELPAKNYLLFWPAECMQNHQAPKNFLLLIKLWQPCYGNH